MSYVSVAETTVVGVGVFVGLGVGVGVTVGVGVATGWLQTPPVKKVTIPAGTASPPAIGTPLASAILLAVNEYGGLTSKIPAISDKRY